MRRSWVGIDVGKQTHWAVALDRDGRLLWSGRVANDQAALQELLATASGLAEELVWAVDLPDGPAALLLALLWQHHQRVVYVPGRAVTAAAAGYPGEGKTDAKDARVIADQARMRGDFTVLAPSQELVAGLGVLLARRRDLVGDRTRQLTRLRQLLLGICPALERALDLTCTGALLLVSGYQTPSAIRTVGVEQLTAWLHQRNARNPAQLATRAVTAAEAQQLRLPGEHLAAQLAAELATQALALTAQIAELDKTIAKHAGRHRHTASLTSLPGMGVLLAAEFLVAINGSLDGFTSPDQLAAYAGLAPRPNDSGKRTGNLHRPRRYHRVLQRACYLSALSSLRGSPASRAFYQRKRAEGKRHTQALIALARRRVNVIWALLRDGRCYTTAPPDGHAAA